MKFLSQESGTCCFVYAVANYQIWRGVAISDLPDFEKAKDIACCLSGSTIKHQEVVDYYDADLDPTEDALAVLNRGGIINIMHPFCNGHCFLVYPEAAEANDHSVTAVNSWLGFAEHDRGGAGQQVEAGEVGRLRHAAS